MDIKAILIMGLISALLALTIRQYRPEYAVLISVGAGVLILIALIGALSPIREEIDALVARINLPGGYTTILFKALGICFITQLACDTCRDVGESAIAGKLELAGKIAVILISFPLFRQLLEIASNLIMGG